MSSKKVKKYIRAQRRAQKRMQKEQQTTALRHASTTSGPPVGTVQPSTSPRRGQVRTAGSTGRLVAVIAGLGLVAAAGGSAGLQLSGGHAEQRVSQPSHMVQASSVIERLVCPPAPGQAASLSDDGVLDYQSRDDSVSFSREAAVFAAAEGQLPTTDWVQLDYEGQTESEVFIDSDQTVEDAGPSMAERPLITGSLDSGLGSVLLQVQPVDGLRPAQDAAATASFTYQADSGPVTGLSSGACHAPQRSQWFLGPESGTNTNSLLSLTNPQDRDATVEVTTFDAEGATGTLGSTTVLIPGNTVRTVNLAGLTEGEAQMAVQVVAQGAPVTAHMQSSWTVGGSSGQGVEQLDALTGPQLNHHALGVPAGAEDDPQLWFYVPGDEHATVELQVFGPEGQIETDTPGVFSLEPGKVSVAGLHGLDPGVYDVMLTTDLPALAAVRSSGDGQPVTIEVELEPEIDPWTGLELEPETEEQETDPASDFSWATAGSPLAEGSFALLPAGYETELRFLAPPGEEQPVEVTYRIFDSAGSSTEDLVEQIDPGSSAQISAEDLQETAEEGGLEDVYSVLITAAEGEAYGGTVTRDEEGRFTIGRLEPISLQDQYVPLRLEP